MEHKWIEKPLEFNEVKEYKFKDKDGNDVVVNLDMHFKVDVKSLRICEHCGQEEIDGQPPAKECGEAVVDGVMKD